MKKIKALLGSGLISGLQDAASPPVGRRASRLCDACDPASCGHGLEEALTDTSAICRFAGIHLAKDSIPDATTILAFCHVVEQHHLAEEKVIHGDAGYQGLEKQEEMAGREVDCRLAMGPGSAATCLMMEKGPYNGGWSGPRLMSEPRWSIPDRCSRSSLGFGKPGDGAWPKITAR